MTKSRKKNKTIEGLIFISQFLAIEGLIQT
jgi:hypothetical protein